MRHTNVLSCFLNTGSWRGRRSRGEGGRGSGCLGDFAYFVLSFSFYFVFFFFFYFTYSEALPALRLRRDDIFGPPVGSALNNP